MTIRVLQEPGRPNRLHRNFRLGNRNNNSPMPAVARRDHREQTTTQTVVSPSEGNEARRDGRLGVGASHSTVEAGEPVQGTRRREEGAVS
jgi:hypothetical protein